MNKINNNPDDQYKNPPIRKAIAETQIQLVGGGNIPPARPPIRPVIIESVTTPPWQKRILRYLGPLSIIVALILGITYIWLSLTGYFNPLNLCYIRIHSDLVSGNKSTIIKAIKLLKKEDHDAYKLTCKYVNRIYERTCIGADWHLDQSLPGSDEPGCYVKGSKSIYLKPDFNKNQAGIVLRKEAIKKYSQLSREFWNQ